jgi:hypothetical protein
VEKHAPPPPRLQGISAYVSWRKRRKRGRKKGKCKIKRKRKFKIIAKIYAQKIPKIVPKIMHVEEKGKITILGEGDMIFVLYQK